MIYCLKAHTGPCLVNQIADKCKAVPEFRNIQRGSESIYVTMEASAINGPAGACWDFCVCLRHVHNTDFGLKPMVLWTTTNEQLLAEGAATHE